MRPCSAIETVRSDLVSRLSHELFGWRFPNGRHSDDPADVLVQQLRASLVAELLEGVGFEEVQGVGEHTQSREFHPVTRHKLRLTI